MKDRLNQRLHWTTTVTEKIMLGGIGALTVLAAVCEVWDMWILRKIVGMVGAYYISNRIPVTLPIIIAMTALCRLIILHSKDADPWVLIAEAGAIVILAGAAYLMSAKEKLSLEINTKPFLPVYSISTYFLLSISSNSFFNNFTSVLGFILISISTKDVPSLRYISAN